jgi:hypothetical protein
MGNTVVTYAEILRCIGQYIDRANLTEVRVIETDDGLILQGLITRGEREGERDTYQLSPDDILALVEDGQTMRGKRF